MASQLEQFSELFGRQDNPEAVALRNKYLQPLLSGQYNDAQRRQLPMFDFQTALKAFLGQNAGVNQNSQQQARSLGVDNTLAQFMQQVFAQPKR